MAIQLHTNCGWLSSFYVDSITSKTSDDVPEETQISGFGSSMESNGFNANCSICAFNPFHGLISGAL